MRRGSWVQGYCRKPAANEEPNEGSGSMASGRGLNPESRKGTWPQACKERQKLKLAGAGAQGGRQKRMGTSDWKWQLRGSSVPTGMALGLAS